MMKLLFTLLILLTTPVVFATYDPVEVKAAFILRFTAFIDLPDTKEQYSVGYIGDKEQFEKFSIVFENKHHKGKSYSIIWIDPLSQDKTELNYVFVKKGSFSNHVDYRKTLIISEEEEGLEKGAIINFIIVDNTVKFEINHTKAKERGIKISSRLLQLAKRVL